MGKAAITGALSFTGRYLATHLLDTGKASSIVNLSSRPHPISSHNVSPEKHLKNIISRPLLFHDESALRDSLKDVDVLYCTYWIRFERDGDNHLKAADRCRTLFQCARDAGVKKVVFSAHTGMSLNSPYSYIEGKAKASQYLRDISNETKSTNSVTKMNYSIVKPCGIFGDKASESILFNNAAFVLRRTPLFLLPHNGKARFQPIHVQDMAELMVSLGHDSIDTTAEEMDAVGPDVPTALELFQSLSNALPRKNLLRRWLPTIVAPSYLPPHIILAATKPIDWITGDVLLDSDDLNLMYSGLTVADNPSDCKIQGRKSVLKWFHEMGEELGIEYVNSMDRYYYDRESKQT